MAAIDSLLTRRWPRPEPDSYAMRFPEEGHHTRTGHSVAGLR